MFGRTGCEHGPSCRGRLRAEVGAETIRTWFERAGGDQAARTVLRKFSTSAFRLRLWSESERADARTCAEAEPVAPAPRLTSVILAATSAVPLAASLTLRAISEVAAPCSSMVAAMVVAILEIRVMVAPISLIAPTESCVAAC